MHQYTSVEAQVEHGLEAVSPDRKIEISLQDLLFVYQVLGEFIRFFHQPAHYPELENVERFLGDSEKGAFSLLARGYYEKLRDVWPEDVEEMIAEGAFDHPTPPYYYAPTDENQTKARNERNRCGLLN